MMRPLFSALVTVLLFAATGCTGHRVVQTCHFVDDDGAIVRVDYGRSEKDHVNTFVSPANGKELEFRSQLAVDVRMPDGDSFTAWQCMNFSSNGTLYKTDDEEWFFLASGFTCKVAQRDENNPGRYNEVYRGVLCNTPVKIPEKDNRWHKVKPGIGKKAAQ